MSMLTYLASSVPLPLGRFVTAPDAVYKNYGEYKESKDFIYIEVEKIYLSPPYEFTLELHETDYPVHIYSSCNAEDFIDIYEYETDNPPTTILPVMGESEVPRVVKDQAVLDQDVTGQFSLPYIYYLGIMFGELALRQFLCTYLKKGEKAELYTCWDCTESEKRDRNWDKVVDLQNFVDNGDMTIPTSEYAEKNEKYFITYNAPTGEGRKFNLIEREDSIRIYTAESEEYIPSPIAKEVFESRL